MALAALGDGDPERNAAFVHAHTCPGCSLALDQAARLLAILDVPMPPPTAELLERTRARALGDGQLRSVASLLALAVAVGLGWTVVVGLARSRDTLVASWMESGVVLLVAIVALVLATSRGLTATTVAAAISAAFALYAGRAGPLAPAIGVKCVALESLAAAAPLLVAAYLVRRRRIDHEATFFAGVGAAGALAGHAALHLTCPVHNSAAHLFAFHLSGVLLAAVLAMFVARLPSLRLARGG